MTRFLPGFMLGGSLDAANYALTSRSGTDLSLVTGPCPWADVVQSCLAAVAEDAVQPYRKPGQDPLLVAAIAAREGVGPESVWLVPGADNGIEFVLGRYLAAGGRIGILAPNFPRFAIVASTLAGVGIEHFPALESMPARLKVAVVCTPCNPTTAEIGEADLRQALTGHPDTLFCIDAVFSWYASWDVVALCREFDNLVVLKSYSKIGLAGLRLGYVVAAADLVAEIRAGRSPFSLPALCQLIALEVEQSIDRVDMIRRWLAERVAPLTAAFGTNMRRETPVPFYELKIAHDSGAATQALAERGILVVDGAKFAGMAPNRLRVAIGSEPENALFIRTIEDLRLLG